MRDVGFAGFDSDLVDRRREANPWASESPLLAVDGRARGRERRRGRVFVFRGGGEPHVQ